MEDRFKFRCWDKVNKIMTYDTEQTYDYMLGFGTECHRSFGDVLEDESYEVIQCTGLKDINGKLIYEGDIIKDIDDTYAIFYLEDLCQFVARSIKDNLCIDIIDLKDEEIIGNTYENPELLEGNNVIS